jgi:hypothetical protein
MPFTGDTFAHLFDWILDPQRQEKIVNARLEAEFDGIDTGLSAVAARATALEGNPPPAAASQSDQETATSTTTYVSPGRQQYHPSAAKFWAKFAGATGTASASYNCSVSRTATGTYTVTIGADMSSADYSVVASDSFLSLITIDTQAAGSFRVRCWSDLAGTLVDPATVSVAGYGDQ